MNIYGKPVTIFRHQTDCITEMARSPNDYHFIEGELGTGKTCIGIKWAEYLYYSGKITQCLILAPNNVHKQWINEQIPEFCEVPFLAAYYCASMKADEKKALNNVMYMPCEKPALRFIAVNYDTFSTKTAWEDFALWVQKDKTLVIADESHFIKSMDSIRTRNVIRGLAACQYRKAGRSQILTQCVPYAAYRLAMTGTMIGNGPIDVYAQFEFLKPNYFNMGYKNFRDRYSMIFKRRIKKNGRDITFDGFVGPKEFRDIKKVPRDWNKWSDYITQKWGITEELFYYIHSQSHYDGAARFLDELKEKIKPVTTVILKADCLDLPAVIYKKRILEMSKGQREFYNRLRDELMVEHDGKYLSVFDKMALLTRLRQVTSGFIPMKTAEDNGDITVEMTKVDTVNVKVQALLNDLEQVTPPSIVVTQFTAEANHIYETLCRSFPSKTIGINTGSRREMSSLEDKCPDLLDRFKNNEVDILVANEMTISAGFNFQNACNMFFYSNCFSLLYRVQIEGRIDRIGQTRHPVYTDYIYKNSIDERIYAALKGKKKMADALRDVPWKEWLA